MKNRSGFTSAPGLILGFAAIALLFVILVALPNSQITEEGFLVLTETEAQAIDSNEQTSTQSEPDWIPATFPIHWRNQFTEASEVWYRLSVSESELRSLTNSSANTEDQLFGLYIWRLNQTADVWFNGVLIGSGGSTSEPMARHWNSPLYFSIPAGLIEANNEILIKHFAYRGWGSMQEIVLGDEYSLKPIFEQRYFVQHDVTLGMFVFVLASGLFSITVWFYRRREVQYLWFAIASVGMSFYCLNQFIRYLPVSADLWRWLSNITTDLWACAIFIFMLRTLQLHKPLAEKLVLTYVLSGIPIYFYASFFQVFDINIYFHTGSLLIGIYGGYLCFNNYLHTKNPLPAYYCCVITLMVLIGTHDTVMQAVINLGWRSAPNLEFANQFNSVQFAGPMIFLIIAASLIKQFIDSMNAADSLNRELEERIGEARQELAENYQAIEQVLIKQSASDERERIYRDLHDDVGSKLLSLYYRLDKESDSVLAKSALQDLRDIVSHKSTDSCLLANAVQQWKEEASERVRDAQVMLSWDCKFVDNELVLTETQHTQLRRMLREVFSNALLHSKDISEIKVNIQASESQLSISVSNDGAPKPVSEWKSGRGISNLHVRSRNMEGSFGIHDLQESWIQAVWTIPLNPV